MSADPTPSREKLLAYLYGELPQEERRSLEGLLQSDPNLRQALEKERKTLDLLDQIKEPEPQGDAAPWAVQIVRGAGGNRPGGDMRQESAMVLSLRMLTPAGERTVEIRADETPADLGRGRSCQVVLDDRGCSRRHARISFSEGRFVLKDLDSANGTLLNGQPVRENALTGGDRISLGGTEAEVSLPEPPPPLDLLLTTEGEKTHYEMDAETVLVGRGKDCGIRLTDPACSRRQAILRRSGGGLRVEILGDLNPALLNGRPVREALLTEGDVLEFGASTLTLLPARAAATPEEEDLQAPVRHRIRRARRDTSAAPLLAGLGLCAAAVLALVVWSSAHPELWRGARMAQPAPKEGPSSPLVLAPDTSPEQRRTALAAIRAGAVDTPPEKIEALRERCWDLIRRFPDTEEAAEALRISRETQARWERRKEERWKEALKASFELEAAGEVRQARAVLAGSLDAGGRSGEAQASLSQLDRRIELEYGQAEKAAMTQARTGRTAEARTALEALQARYAGLPWGSAAKARLSELGAMEQERQHLAQTEKVLLRADAEARLAASEREARRRQWTADQEILARMLSTWSKKQAAERKALFTAIAKVDPAVSAPLKAALHKAHQSLVGRLKPRLNSDAVQTIQARLRGSLDGRRKEALALIRDEVRYPYLMGQANPYGPDGPKVQREVDELVRRVEEAYRPAQDMVKVLRETEGMEEIVAGMEETEGYLIQSGAEPARKDSLQGLLEKAFGDAFDFGKEDEALRTNAAILATTAETLKRMKAEGTLNAAEEECILTTNRYRIMMGLLPLKVDPRLLKASRGHSDDMSSRAYFSHVDPEGRGPGNRAQAAGFVGPCGENIYMGSGSGQAAFEAWCHSSGHHRNMLSAMWSVIGTGQNGAYWTMMLGN